MTVRELHMSTAQMVDEDIDLVTNIDDDTKLILDKFLGSYNHAYQKVAKDKLLFLTKEEVEVENKKINTEYLMNKLCLILRIEDDEGNRVDYSEDGNSEVLVDTEKTSVTIYYYYIPKKLVDLDDSTKFPPDVDERILCYFAAYEYLNMEGGSEERVKAQDNLLAFNDAVDNIRKRRMPSKYIKKVGEF